MDVEGYHWGFGNHHPDETANGTGAAVPSFEAVLRNPGPLLQVSAVR